MLTSSAVGGRKAAPKAPPRRRAPPKTSDRPASEARPAEPTLATPGETTSEQHGETERNEPVVEERRALPSPPVVVERSVTASNAGAVHETRDEPGNEAQSNSHTALPTAVAPQVDSLNSLAEVEPQRPVSQGTKRANESTGENGPSAPKRARITKTSQPTRDAAAQRQDSRIESESASNSQSAVGAGEADTVAQAEAEQPQPSTRRRVASRRARGAESSAAPVARRPRARKANKQSQGASSLDQIANATSEQTQIVGSIEPHVEQNAPHPPAAKPPRQRRKKKAVGNDEVAGTDNGAANTQAAAVDNASEAAEESDHENHQIDPVTLSMYELSHDTKHGKTSEREKKMAQIDWREVARKRREEADAIMNGELQPEQEGQIAVQSTEGQDGIASTDANGHDPQGDADNDNEQPTTQPEPITRASGAGVRFRIVGGQLVEDEASLTIDRAARVAQAAADTGEPVEEENDLTTRFNRTTYINARKRDPTERVPLWRSKSDAWTEEETDRFYDALTMFGTDFFIISKMFMPRTRKQIKLKFVREERLEPDRVNAALLGRHTRHIDLDQYAQAINRDVNDFHKYDGLEHANEVIRASMKDKEEAMRAAVKEDEENNRQREAQRQQREKQRLEAEKKKEERAKKKAMSRRGDIWGAGTLGGADDDNDED